MSKRAPARRRLVFDIETEPFPDEFRDARTADERRRFAPQPRLACVYDVTTRAYRYYTDGDWTRLVMDLANADGIISFNGNEFDVLVLQEHCTPSVRHLITNHPGHVDICEIMVERAGFRVSLDKAVTWNLGERKHTSGRSMEALSLDELKVACRSDVSQTYRLWELHLQGKLWVPTVPTPRPPFVEIEHGPGQFMPRICPNCHDVGSLRFAEADIEEDMTEGQLATYMAGTWGYADCATCGYHGFWNM